MNTPPVRGPKRPPTEEELEPENWIHLYGDYLFRFAVLRVRRREIAEELVQEALLSGVKALDGFEGKASVKHWLTSILRNKIIDYLRKEKKGDREQVQIEDPVVEGHFNSFGIWNTILPDWGSTPHTTLHQKDFYLAVQNCLDKLPPRLGKVISLKVIDQVETEEVCKIMDITASNLWVLIHRARIRLRDCIEKTWYNSG